MNLCPYDTESFFPGWSGAQKWLFWLKFGSGLGRKHLVLCIIWLEPPWRPQSSRHRLLIHCRSTTVYCSLWRCSAILAWVTRIMEIPATTMLTRVVARTVQTIFTRHDMDILTRLVEYTMADDNDDKKNSLRKCIRLFYCWASYRTGYDYRAIALMVYNWGAIAQAPHNQQIITWTVYDWEAITWTGYS